MVMPSAVLWGLGVRPHVCEEPAPCVVADPVVGQKDLRNGNGTRIEEARGMVNVMSSADALPLRYPDHIRMVQRQQNPHRYICIDDAVCAATTPRESPWIVSADRVWHFEL